MTEKYIRENKQDTDKIDNRDMSLYQMVGPKEARTFLLSFAAFLGRSIRFIYRAVWQNVLLVLLITAAGSLAAFYLWRSQPSFYESSMVCSFNNLHKKTFGEMVKRLNLLAVTGSHNQLSALLGISAEQAKAIRGFEAKNIAGSPLDEDITTEKLPMYFTLRATSLDVFPPVQEGLLNYLNSSPYQQLRVKLEKEKIAGEVIYLDASIHRLDSVIDAYSSFLKRTTAVSDTAAGFSNIAALFRLQEELENRKLNEVKISQMLQSVELVYGFAPAEKPAGKGYDYLLKLVSGSFVLAILIALLKKILANG